MDLPSKEKAISNWKKIFLGIIAVILIAGILFYTGNYPLEINDIKFVLGIGTTLAMWGGIYLILKYVYKPK